MGKQQANLDHPPLVAWLVVAFHKVVGLEVELRMAKLGVELQMVEADRTCSIVQVEHNLVGSNHPVLPWPLVEAG